MCSSDLNAVDTSFRPQTPQFERDLDGLHYRLYRVRGEFRNDFDFHDYPFDRQTLALRVQHPRYTREQVIYVVDTLGLRPSQRGTAARTNPFASLDNWTVVSTRAFQETLAVSSTRGDPAVFDIDRETEYSMVSTVAVLQRRTSVFLLKTLLPLALLVAMVYLTLFFPATTLLQKLAVPGCLP